MSRSYDIPKFEAICETCGFQGEVTQRSVKDAKAECFCPSCSSDQTFNIPSLRLAIHVFEKLPRDYVSKKMEAELQRGRAERLLTPAKDCISTFEPSKETLITAERQEMWVAELERDAKESERIDSTYG